MQFFRLIPQTIFTNIKIIDPLIFSQLAIKVNIIIANPLIFQHYTRIVKVIRIFIDYLPTRYNITCIIKIISSIINRFKSTYWICTISISIPPFTIKYPTIWYPFATCIYIIISNPFICRNISIFFHIIITNPSLYGHCTIRL